MQGGRFLRNTQIIILGVCIAAATIISTVILSNGLLRMKKFSDEVIDVTGSAEKKIISNYIVWKAEFRRRNSEMTLAFDQLKEDLNRVKEYLISSGISVEEIVVEPVVTEVLYKKTEKGYDTNEVEGYRLSQEIEVRSYDVDKTIEVSRKSTELINEDIRFISGAPEFFYTKLAELKVEMLARATEDAKTRAESMAASTGSKIGLMRSARMGVFQITPVNSYDVSWYGNNDTSSYEKKVTAVVNASFAIKEDK